MITMPICKRIEKKIILNVTREEKEKKLLLFRIVVKSFSRWEYSKCVGWQA